MELVVKIMILVVRALEVELIVKGDGTGKRSWKLGGGGRIAWKTIFISFLIFLLFYLTTPLH